MSIEQVIRSVDEQISKLQQAKAILNGTGSGKATGRGRGPRTMSAAARARIAAAQHERWAQAEITEEEMNGFERASSSAMKNAHDSAYVSSEVKLLLRDVYISVLSTPVDLVALKKKPSTAVDVPRRRWPQ